MKLFDVFRKGPDKQAIAKSDAARIWAEVDGIYERTAGSAIPLPSQLVAKELWRNKPASYELSNDSQSIRLGVFYFFASLSASKPPTKGLGAILTHDEPFSYIPYLHDNYGMNHVSAVDLLAAYEINIIGELDLEINHAGLPSMAEAFLERQEKSTILIASSKKVVQLRLRSSLFSLPIIEDDGLSVKRLTVK